MYVAARRKDGKEGPQTAELQKRLLIQQSFPPFCRLLPFFPFCFPHSQCPTGARPATTGVINEGFWQVCQNLAGISNFRL